MTAPLEIRVPSPKTIYVPQPVAGPSVPPVAPVETQETASSPAPVAPPVPVVDHGTEPAQSRLENIDSHIESIKVTYEDQIAKLHENYQ